MRTIGKVRNGVIAIMAVSAEKGGTVVRKRVAPQDVAVVETPIREYKGVPVRTPKKRTTLQMAIDIIEDTLRNTRK